jgi:hypothetical protein
MKSVDLQHVDKNSPTNRSTGPYTSSATNGRSVTTSSSAPSPRFSASSSMKHLGARKSRAGSEATTETTQSHWATMTFKERALEAEYEKFVFQKNLYSWRRNIALITLVATMLQMSLMASDEIHSSYWRSTYASSLKGSVTSSNISQYCPQGWFWYV